MMWSQQKMETKMTVYVSKENITFQRIYVLPSGSHIVEISYPKMSGETGVAFVNFGDFRNPRKLGAELFDKGADGAFCEPSNIVAMEESLRTYAASEEGRANTIAILATGWSDDMTSFRLGDLELPSGRRVPVLPGLDTPVLTQAGTLEEWKNNVAAAACHSSAMMFLISATFVAPTLKLFGIEAGGFGFNLFGKSSSGKSTALLAAASVFGSTFTGKWNATVTGLEERAQANSDLPFTLDSLEDVPAASRPAVMETMSYVLSSGSPKLRGKVYETKNGIASRRFRSLVLSTEEDQNRPRHRTTGSAVRLIDVFVKPADSSFFGIVDMFPEDVAVEARAEWAKLFVKKVEAAVAQQHGTALEAFVRLLIMHRVKATERLKTYKAAFMLRNEFAGLNSVQNRTLDAFAHVYAAGRLAIDMGTVPWAKERLLRAVGRCASTALAKSADRAQIGERNAKRLITWLSDPDRRPVDYSTELAWKEAEGADFIRLEQKRNLWALVRGETARRALRLTVSELTDAAKVLRERGQLVTERPNTPTFQYPVEGVRRCFYMVVLR